MHALAVPQHKCSNQPKFGKKIKKNLQNRLLFELGYYSSIGDYLSRYGTIYKTCVSIRILQLGVKWYSNGHSRTGPLGAVLLVPRIIRSLQASFLYSGVDENTWAETIPENYQTVILTDEELAGGCHHFR